MHGHLVYGNRQSLPEVRLPKPQRPPAHCLDIRGSMHVYSYCVFTAGPMGIPMKALDGQGLGVLKWSSLRLGLTVWSAGLGVKGLGGLGFRV